ncbi:MAG: hypothetical protein JWP52_1177 [Rhizobacter sp.]|nr:hypothetical protein [Rhizobacter sp.]
MKSEEASPVPLSVVAVAKVLKPSFRGVVLVCGDCEDRSSGPKKLKSKNVRKRLKEALRPAKGQLRVAVTGCLGPCPKKAMTVAAVVGGSVCLKALDHIDQAAAMGAEAVAALQPAD